jgi:hypothetical protein
MPSSHCQCCDFLVDDAYQCNLADPRICGPCQQISDLDTKIKETKMALLDLRNARLKLKEQANHNHDHLSHRLPPEIAAYIFEFCLPDDVLDIAVYKIQKSNAAKYTRYTFCAPYILSAVCRRWRTIVHSTPRLWDTLLLRFQALGSRFSPTPHLVKDWIARAGQLPLSVSLYMADALTCEEAQGNAIEIINVLNECPSIRWLKYKGPRSFAKIFKLLSCPSLKTLVLCTLPSIEINMPLIVKFLGRSGCSLERLSLAGLSNAGVTSLCCGIPTLQHLHVELYLHVGYHFLALLAEFSAIEKGPRYLPALRSLTLYVEAVHDGWTTTLPDIFGTTSDGHSTSHQRPALQSVLIHVFPNVPADLNSSLEIDKDTLNRVLSLREAGVKWKILFGPDGTDMIEHAVAQH